MLLFRKDKHNEVMVFDYSGSELNQSVFQDENWTSTPYGECKEVIHKNTPKPRELGFTYRASINSDHAGDWITRRSRNDFILWSNNVPTYWYSKKQRSCET